MAMAMAMALLRKAVVPLLYLACFDFSKRSASAKNMSFDFPSLSLWNFTLVGDSYLRNDVVGLTRDVIVPSSSSGSIVYNNPLEFYDSASNTTASFSTKFSFAIQNVNPSSFGDGFAFFLSQDNRTLSTPGGHLEIADSWQLGTNRLIAVEFDTKIEANFSDPNVNHVCLVVDSLDSIETVDPIVQGIDLKSGNFTKVWIEYKSDARNLEVFMSYADLMPEKPLLSINVDLSPSLRQAMYVGLSGSMEGSTELHLISNWSFSIDGFPLPSTNSSSIMTNKRGGKLVLYLEIAGPALICMILVILCWVSAKKWQANRERKCTKVELVSRPREFTYKELSSATKGFHSSRVIGNGSFGDIYQAFFATSGTLAAVKRSKNFHESKAEFLAELTIIAGLRHKNIVQLHGWCIDREELLIVCEYMPYGSLDKILYRESESEESPLLTWSDRQNIAIGLASALAYLHKECDKQVIHRDIKASNIMLDSNMNPRLGDFGLARLMDHGKSPISTLTAGTIGYLAPEYLHNGKATEKTDMYSYGVVMLEVACGRRPIEKELNSQQMVNLVDWVWKLWA